MNNILLTIGILGLFFIIFLFSFLRVLLGKNTNVNGFLRIIRIVINLALVIYFGYALISFILVALRF